IHRGPRPRVVAECGTACGSAGVDREVPPLLGRPPRSPRALRAEQRQEKKMNAAHASATVVVRRTIAASAEDLFDAWLDPEALATWLRPGPVRSTVAKVEPYEGGSYEITMSGRSGP